MTTDSSMKSLKNFFIKFKLPIIIVVALVVVAVAALLIVPRMMGKKKPETKVIEATAKPVSVIIAQRASISEELELTGTCQAVAETDVTAEMAGKVLLVAKDVGQPIRRGEMLVALDRSLASRQREQAESAVQSSEAQLNRAVKSSELTDRETVSAIRQAEQGIASAREQLRKSESSYKLTVEQSQNSIQQAKVGLASAQAQERDVVSGARNQEIAQSEAMLRQAESDLQLKKTNYERYLKLYNQGAVAAATLDSYQTQYEVAQQSVRQSREALSLAKEGARQEQRRIASLSVERAQEQLKLAESGRKQNDIAARDLAVARVGLQQAQENLRFAKAGRKRYDVSIADIRSAKAGVGQAQAGSSMARTSESKYTIYAPIDGILAAKNTEVGEWASPGASLVRIVNNKTIRVDCEVSELDISKIKVGDQGVVSVDGLPGKTFYGLIRDVAPQSREKERNYIARVEIDNAEGLIKAGMFARVKLTISQKNDVIVVPRDTLVERGEDRTAYVVADGIINIRKVKIGAMNGREIELVSGVNAGEQLVIAGQAMLAEGEAVAPQIKNGDQQPAVEQGAEAITEPPAAVEGEVGPVPPPQ